MKPNFLLINKPKDWTSHDVVSRVRTFVRTNVRTCLNKKNNSQPLVLNSKIKVGHAGTLDPFATGLLIVGIGREATKRLDEFKNMPKIYETEIMLGATSNTQDSTGIITPFISPLKNTLCNKNKLKNLSPTTKIITPSKKQIKKFLQEFLGKQKQIPPMFSAKKINGKKLYELAREGKEIERKASLIEIYKIKLLKYKYPHLKIRVKCSAGTYIRTLANDIGEKLQTGAYCNELTRTQIGKYKLKKAIKIEDLK